MNEATKKPRRAVKIIIPVLILVCGIFAFKMLGKLKQAPQRQVQVQQGVLVDVVALKPTDYQTTIFATGTVQAEQEIELVPEVSGKVTWISADFVAGGFFKAGDLLLKIDPSNYLLGVEKANAEIAQAQLALATEKERARIALSEWQRVDIADKGTPGPLVTREIQLQQEEARLAAARANLKQAQLDLQRTELRAPFNGRIRQEQVGIGQYLKNATSVGTFAGTDRAEIHVPVAAEELAWLDETNTVTRASIQVPAQAQKIWTGKLARTTGEIDSKSRLATLIVTVEDPYRLNAVDKTPTLPNGQFVNVELQGRTLKNILQIPRGALRSNATIWVADNNNRLAIHPVEVLRRERDSLLIKAELNNTDRLILSTLSGVADGTLLRPVEREQTR